MAKGSERPRAGERVLALAKFLFERLSLRPAPDQVRDCFSATPRLTRETRGLSYLRAGAAGFALARAVSRRKIVSPSFIRSRRSRAIVSR